MRAVLRGRAALLALTAGVALQARTGARPSALDLSALTVPAERLADGCGLAPLKEDVGGGRFYQLPIPVATNPWTGTERPAIAAIRQHFSAPVVVPDAPLSRREARAFFLHAADGISEAYAGFYGRNAGSGLVSVYALRFEKAADADALTNENPRARPELMRDSSLVVAIEGQQSPCFAAVRQYVKSVVPAGRGPHR